MLNMKIICLNFKEEIKEYSLLKAHIYYSYHKENNELENNFYITKWIDLSKNTIIDLIEKENNLSINEIFFNLKIKKNIYTYKFKKINIAESFVINIEYNDNYPLIKLADQKKKCIIF